MEVSETKPSFRRYGIQYERCPGFRATGPRQVHEPYRAAQPFDRTNLIWPANGIGLLQAAYGPRITVYDVLTVPLPAL